MTSQNLALTGFKGDIVVAIIDHPPCQGNIRRVDRIKAVSVKIISVCVVLEVGVVNVDVL